MKANWDKRFLELADFIAKWSKDPSSKIGAVIVDKDRRIVSTGYNGFAVGVKDKKERLENREIKYPLTLHAEENAILFSKQNLSDCSLYVSGLYPCAHCSSIIAQVGIKDVYTWKLKDIPERWKSSFALTKQIFKEANIRLHLVDRERE